MTKDLICEPTLWNNRKAYRLSNGLVQLVTLTGGGHIAEFQFERSTGLPKLNPLWNPHWKSIEPYRYRPDRHASQYGSLTEGKLLSGIAGHSICLDRFGPPSAEEVAHGLSFHGEAPSVKWSKTLAQVSSVQAALTLSVNLPVANLNFSREIKLRQNESVAYFTERVENLGKSDRAFQWQQHVSLGSPFLHPSDCRVFLPATHGITDPGGYDEGKALLAPGKKFRWPFAPLRAGGSVDLRRTLIHGGLGFVVGLLLDTKRQSGFVAALNRQRCLLFAYCFPRKQFPWVAIWEENRAVAATPWRRRGQARGLEFGSTALPVSRYQALMMGSLWGTPTFAFVPAKANAELRYLALLAEVPAGFTELVDIMIDEGNVLLFGSKRQRPLRLRAVGIKNMF